MLPVSEANMITATEYREWAEECLEWAAEAATPEERDAHIRSAEIWLQSALRSERFPNNHPQPNTNGCSPLSTMAAKGTPSK
jgi:hypothetical protein